MADRRVSRRAILAKGTVVSAVLAGCSSNSSSDETPTDTATATDSPTETASPTETPTATESPTPAPPTVEEFPYPDGASQSGIEAGTLYTTHRSAITDAGSVTVAVEQSRDSGDFSSSFTETNAFSSGELSRTTERSEVTESLWAPSGESAAYVQMDTGFEQRYRIDNSAPRPQELLRLQQAQFLLAGATWSEATEVVEVADDEFAVVYDATGVADEESLARGARTGGTVNEFTASITVTEAGYLHEFSYAITVEQDGRTVQQAATVTSGSLGATTVEEPSWSDTAREDGVRFSVGTADNNRLIEMELVNGTEVSAQTNAQVSAENAFASGSLGQLLSVGETLYLGISDGDLLVGVDEMPEAGTDLGRFAFLSLNVENFALFEADVQL